MNPLKLRGIRDIEIFGISLKRSAKTVAVVATLALGLSFLASFAGLALLSVKFVAWVAFMPISALAWVFGFQVPGILSLALWGTALYGAWKYLRK